MIWQIDSMNICQICKNSLSGRQKKFCCKKCLTISNGRKTGGWNKNKQQLFCLRCGNEYEVNIARLKTSKYCSILCHNRSNAEKTDYKKENNPRWKGGIQCYREIGWNHFEKQCYDCKSKENLDIHHINSDRYDNRIENLIPLCRSCHQNRDGRKHQRDEKGRFISRDASFLL